MKRAVQVEPFTAEALGRMTDAELTRIRRCTLCLETYANCGCKRGRERRKAELERSK